MIDSFNIEISNELKNASILYRNIFLKNNNLVDRLSALIDTIDDESDEKSKLKILKKVVGGDEVKVKKKLIFVFEFQLN